MNQKPPVIGCSPSPPGEAVEDEDRRITLLEVAGKRTSTQLTMISRHPATGSKCSKSQP